MGITLYMLWKRHAPYTDRTTDVLMGVYEMLEQAQGELNRLRLESGKDPNVLYTLEPHDIQGGPMELSS